MIVEQIFLFLDKQGPLGIFLILVLLAVGVVMLLELLENRAGNRRN